MTTLTIGTKVQRKGSSVIWTVIGRDTLTHISGDPISAPKKDLGIENTKEVHLSCLPKNRSSEMWDWIDLDSYNKNWREVA